ncbi:MAG TPA: transposase, partial [Mycobacterium sp.]|nr:transposase [Mycobacterium sp.]
KADPAGIVRSVPGAGRVCAPQILGRLGDPTRLANLAAVRSFAGLVLAADSSGQADSHRIAPG